MIKLFDAPLFIRYFVVQSGFDDNRNYIVRVTREKTETAAYAEFQVTYNTKGEVLNTVSTGFDFRSVMLFENCFTDKEIAKNYVNDVQTMAMTHLQDIVLGRVARDTLSFEELGEDSARIEVFHSDYECIQIPLASGARMEVNLI